MKRTENQSYHISCKSAKRWMDVTEEVYQDYMRMCDRIRKKKQYHKECKCPRNKYWLCDGCCDDCEFKVPGRVTSLDAPITSDQYEDFLTAFEKSPNVLTEFSMEAFSSLVDFITVYSEKDIRITFRNGQEVKA